MIGLSSLLGLAVLSGPNTLRIEAHLGCPRPAQLMLELQRLGVESSTASGQHVLRLWSEKGALGYDLSRSDGKKIDAQQLLGHRSCEAAAEIIALSVATRLLPLEVPSSPRAIRPFEDATAAASLPSNASIEIVPADAIVIDEAGARLASPLRGFWVPHERRTFQIRRSTYKSQIVTVESSTRSWTIQLAPELWAVDLRMFLYLPVEIGASRRVSESNWIGLRAGLLMDMGRLGYYAGAGPVLRQMFMRLNGWWGLELTYAGQLGTYTTLSYCLGSFLCGASETVPAGALSVGANIMLTESIALIGGEVGLLIVPSRDRDRLFTAFSLQTLGLRIAW